MQNDEPKPIGAVNLEKGYLVLFVSAFIVKYGPSSNFVRATSDFFTNAMARIMADNNMPVPENVASYAPVEAEEALTDLIRSLVPAHGRPAAAGALFQEAVGVTPIGTFPDFVDSTHGAGCFQRWQTAFEAEQYEVARQSYPEVELE